MLRELFEVPPGGREVRIDGQCPPPILDRLFNLSLLSQRSGQVVAGQRIVGIQFKAPLE